MTHISTLNSLLSLSSVAMSLRAIIAKLLLGDGSTVVVECRQCGTTVAPENDVCPECEASEFSEYDIPAS